MPIPLFASSTRGMRPQKIGPLSPKVRIQWINKVANLFFGEKEVPVNIPD